MATWEQLEVGMEVMLKGLGAIEKIGGLDEALLPPKSATCKKWLVGSLNDSERDRQQVLLVSLEEREETFLYSRYYDEYARDKYLLDSFVKPQWLEIIK